MLTLMSIFLGETLTCWQCPEAAMTPCALPTQVDCSLTIPGALEPDDDSEEYVVTNDYNSTDINSPGIRKQAFNINKSSPYKCVTAIGGNYFMDANIERLYIVPDYYM